MVKNNFPMSTPTTFQALWINEQHEACVQEVPVAALPEHEVTIRVRYSSLNYKDALSARGKNNVTKSYPHIPGIDASGSVIHDKSNTFEPGTQVIVTGHDLGTNTFGGFGGMIKVPVSWVIALPNGLTAEQAMWIGTAGFTALYGILRLQREGITAQNAPILVTGSTGGVGSFAVFSLSSLGYQVHAASRSEGVDGWLSELGARQIVRTSNLMDQSAKPLLSSNYAGCIETVGGALLDAILRQIRPKGAVACCGNILGIELNTNVLPFILRGVSLLGIDSAFCERSIREEIWELATTLPLKNLPETYVKKVTLTELPHEIDQILDGQQRGRVVVVHE
jgi:putative YhdH/YhfP family quinone oxidoreductase